MAFLLFKIGTILWTALRYNWRCYYHKPPMKYTMGTLHLYSISLFYSNVVISSGKNVFLVFISLRPTTVNYSSILTTFTNMFRLDGQLILKMCFLMLIFSGTFSLGQKSLLWFHAKTPQADQVMDYNLQNPQYLWRLHLQSQNNTLYCLTLEYTPNGSGFHWFLYLGYYCQASWCSGGTLHPNPNSAVLGACPLKHINLFIQSYFKHADNMQGLMKVSLKIMLVQCLCIPFQSLNV